MWRVYQLGFAQKPPNGGIAVAGLLWRQNAMGGLCGLSGA